MRELTFRVKGRRCVLCRIEGRTTRATQVDHDVPRALGGGDELTNLLPVCGPHNQAKGKGKYQPPPTPPIAGNGEPVSPRFR
jgi:5-methylcytosine-specific restriction endonuclease McrA